MASAAPSHGPSGGFRRNQRVAETGQALHIHPFTASNLLGKLEARGFVRRERRDRDNRVVRPYLTEAGFSLVQRIPGLMEGVLRSALQQVSPPVLTALLQGVTVVLDFMDESSHRTYGLQGIAVKDNASKEKQRRVVAVLRVLPRGS